MDILRLAPKQDHLEKIARTTDIVRAISEFVWNSFDGDATDVSVEFHRNTLGGIQEIVIRDNGDGITPSRAEHDFMSLGDSWKLKAQRTPRHKRAIHGKEGRGRLRFFSLAQFAEWSSISDEDGGRHAVVLRIKADDLAECQKSVVLAPDGEKLGTIVRLTGLKNTFDWLAGRQAFLEMATRFSPYLLEYPSVQLKYDGQIVKPGDLIAKQHDFASRSIAGPTRVIDDLKLKVIEWNAGIDGRKIHFGREDGVILGSQAANVVAPGFEFSAYAYSSFFEEMMAANLLELDDLAEPNFAAVVGHIRSELGDYFRGRMAERSSGLIDELIRAGVYPYEGDPKDAVEKHERQVFDIATYVVDSYSKEFKKADASVKRMTLALLREALRHNPEALSRILHAVVNLPKNRQDELSALLERTELANIIAASSLVAGRVAALQMLSGMVFDPAHRMSTRERGELDELVRDNTWIFGEGFHIALAESGLTKVMKRVAAELAVKRSRGRVTNVDGKIGRVDQFLGRSIPHPDQNHREFLLVELKRPSITVGRKELDQLEDYANAILAQPEYINTSTNWNFFLVTGNYDDSIKARITQSGRPVGLFHEQETHRIWVKSWAELVRESEGRINFIQDKLKFELPEDEIERRIAALKKKIIGEKRDGA
ncbi:hypothetical protein EJ073_20525 [Mesorhizobium sp. M4B.F.Ca.ET.058.02.1.1]|nr:hypothetical protein EJ073_20525 [Mesorhizobium sp. M4B.F.Ca.ET.058.02.1.1]